MSKYLPKVHSIDMSCPGVDVCLPVDRAFVQATISRRTCVDLKSYGAHGHTALNTERIAVRDAPELDVGADCQTRLQA